MDVPAVPPSDPQSPDPGPRDAVLPRALVVDDDPGFRLGLAELVTREGFAVTCAGSLEQARAAIAAKAPDILLVDLRLPDGSGLDLLADFESVASPEVVLITGSASVETAVEALRRGAIDYLTKPVDFARIKMALANVTRTLGMKGEIGTLRGELRKLGRFGPLIGRSAAMQAVYDLIGRVAPTDASVLITGETGTGKDVVAVTIHSLSRRSKAAFLPVNCGAISANLIESELFGHERGSFTGADRSHKGYFERAHRGTVFLDEITEMPAGAAGQAAARAGDRARHPRGRQRADPGRRAHPRRHEPPGRRGGGLAQAARGSALPAERLPDRARPPSRPG